MTPQRIQRRRTKGWRMPPNTVYVGRGSRWGNPFSAKDTQTRTPPVYSTDQEWELEGRSGKPNGEINYFYHPDGRVTSHMVWPATASQLVELYRAYLKGGGVWPITTRGLYVRTSDKEIREALAGKNLACWCPLVDSAGNPVPCHADVLLEIANGDTK